MSKKTTRKLVKEKNATKSIAEPIKPEKVRSTLSELGLISLAPESVYIKAGKIMEKLKETWNISEEESAELWKYYSSINSTKTHVLLAETVRDERDRTMIMEFAEDLIKEFECTKIYERALCEIVASHYMGVMKASRNMNNFQNLETLSEVKNSYYAILGKELERQQRMYLHAFQSLQAMKSPPINISLKANNAFIAQNQQFNNNPNQLWENQ